MSETEDVLAAPLLANASAAIDHAPCHSAPVSATLKIAIVDCISFTRECIALSIGNVGRHLSCAETIEIETFASCDDLLGSNTCFTTILYHFQSSPGENLDDLRKLAASPAALIILSPDESIGTIRAAFECGARGYIPSRETGLDSLIKILPFINAGGTFVPSSVLAQTDMSQKIPHRVTEREMLILNLIKLGKQNKVVAYELGLSESTVKVHVRNILSKLGVKNRTEAVSAAMQLTPNEVSNGQHGGLEQQLNCKKSNQVKSVTPNKDALAAVHNHNQRQAAHFRNLAEMAITPALRARLLQQVAD